MEHQWSAPEDADIVIAGSILEHLPSGWTGTVCGAGKLRENSVVDLSAANVVALRGKLTADSVRGLRGPVVLGDPGLLVPDWIEQPVAKYDLGVLPHWSDHQLAGRFLYGQLIKASDSPETVITEIARCKRLISSSLHGIIVADAYGIPRRAELFARAANEGGDFKYRDYCSLYDTHPHFGEMWRAPHYMVERARSQLRMVLAAAVGKPALQSGPTPPCDVFPRQDGLPARISLLVPLNHGGDNEHRARVWKWLVQFWQAQLPTAEVVVGYDQGAMFSKSRAINRAAQVARGEVFVIIDADAYLDPGVISDCAQRINAATARGARVWFVPYRRLYRMSEDFTLNLLDSDAEAPFSMQSPPLPEWKESAAGANVNAAAGYRFGAMLQIMPAAAFFMAGGMDPRFQGWGGEDAAFMRAVDTIYSSHEVTDNDIYHLWHERPGRDYLTRRWVGQQVLSNVRLAQRYSLATGEVAFMESLVTEHSVYGAGFSAARSDWEG